MQINELKQHILDGNSLSKENSVPFIAYVESLEQAHAYDEDVIKNLQKQLKDAQEELNVLREVREDG